MVGPYYSKPTQGRLLSHFAAVAEAVDLPIVAQHSRPHRLEHPAGDHRGSGIENVVGVKEATGSLDQASQIAALSNLTLLSGDDSLTLPLMSIGGRGVISVVGNIVPKT